MLFAAPSALPCWQSLRTARPTPQARCPYYAKTVLNNQHLRSTFVILMQRWLAQSAYGTWEWSGLFYTLRQNLGDSLAAANDTMKPAVEKQIKTLETRAQSFWEAKVGFVAWQFIWFTCACRLLLFHQKGAAAERLRRN